ncbi:MAG: hypothetical protein AAB383_04380 [Patescibacteria group bacterium]
MSTCKQCNRPYEITSEDEGFYKKFSARDLGRCFECSQKNHLALRNARCLYHRKCDATSEDTISMYSPDKPYKVYKSDHWYSDAWDAMDYGQDFDFSRSFFGQLKELQLKVPRLALSNINAMNSDYCNSSYGNKNCYLIFGGDNNEDCMFGTLCMKNTRSLDLDFSNFNELSYMLADCFQCYNTQFAIDSKSCTDSAFLSDCTSCSDCILCSNLVNKSYCILNKQYSKEEYFLKKAELLNGTYSQQKQLFDSFKALLGERIVKYAHTVSCQNCSGDYIKNSKNCTMCFNVTDSEDLRNIVFANKSKDCFNSSMLGDNSELAYETVSAYRAYNVQFSFFVIDSSNIEYCDVAINSKDLFGCVGMRNKQYCIFNKQYSKEDFEYLRTKIIEHMKKTGEWGEFFPKTFSCFAYNETTANVYQPMTKERALAEGYTWKDEDHKKVHIPSSPLPDKIEDVSDSILKEILLCEGCQKNYRIISQELQFYRAQRLPIPHLCSECRQGVRKDLLNPRQLWQRPCDSCGSSMQTTYSPKRPEKVYCEACYLKTVY